MVDREARRKYAELVRQFISGRMTHDDYNKRYFAMRFYNKDFALTEVRDNLDDLFESAWPNRMTRQWRLDREARRRAAQAVLFLQSDQEYPWHEDLWDGSAFLVTAFLIVLLFALFPETAWIVRLSLAGLLMFGWLKYENWQAKRHEKVGDSEAWPFLHQADLEQAKRHPKLLNGKHAA